ncbi:prenyltransferase/squalene oxidase repeat-containing protein [Sanguibacter suaedae]|uniref:Terpene cyclase/mutase family protein n=1 Tax=Sanguibacter suaedae TaxID=2795737 RepID=A0A934I8N5_9MICO|nr:prenyltransferase/squalene oxidase repeat-containing protein [Sanguibacter suaedae]MBI9114230.1 terpene cyclase/mutase family protein [Sanguibacter suaedae]
MLTHRSTSCPSVPGRRAVLVTASLVALVLSGCSSDPEGTDAPSASVSADAGTTADHAQASATWLADLSDGQVVETEFDGATYPDQGLTADIVLALTAAGDTAGAAELATALAAPDVVLGYVGDGQDALYAGSLAKLVTVLDTAGLDPRNVDGRDLVAELEGLEAPTGRFSDRGADDYSHTVSQAWALLASSTVGEGTPSGTAYLVAQQCTDGGYPAQLADEPDGDCEGDVDATAFSVSALVAAGEDPEAETVSRALGWLDSVRLQEDSGAAWAASGEETPNTNSTAVVVSALEDAGQDGSAGRDWLVGQVGEDGTFAVAGEPDARATAQATIALAGTGLAQVLGAGA